MISYVALAALAGTLVGVSRQINGRLSLASSPLVASFWNHLVGFALLTLIGILFGGLLPGGALEAPLFAYLDGPIGVVFVAAGSWLIPRIGAVNTALFVIAGQMVFGVVLDVLLGAAGTPWLSVVGVCLIIAGMVVAQTRRRGGS
jgi:transporter family-2 protein